MNQKMPVDHKDIAFFLEVLSSYCIFYFGEEEGLDLYGYYFDSHAYLMPAIKNGKHVYGEKFDKLNLVLIKIKSDIFFNKIDVFHVKWPYDKGEIQQIDFDVFELTCFDFYGTLGECQKNKKERLKLGFHNRILGLLLPPQKDLIFNHKLIYNNSIARMERLYGELRRRELAIKQKYGKDYWQFTMKDFGNYICKEIEKTPQQLTTALWYCLKRH